MSKSGKISEIGIHHSEIIVAPEEFNSSILEKCINSSNDKGDPWLIRTSHSTFKWRDIPDGTPMMIHSYKATKRNNKMDRWDRDKDYIVMEGKSVAELSYGSVKDMIRSEKMIDTNRKALIEQRKLNESFHKKLITPDEYTRTTMLKFRELIHQRTKDTPLATATWTASSNISTASSNASADFEKYPENFNITSNLKVISEENEEWMPLLLDLWQHKVMVASFYNWSPWHYNLFKAGKAVLCKKGVIFWLMIDPHRYTEFGLFFYAKLGVSWVCLLVSINFFLYLLVSINLYLLVSINLYLLVSITSYQSNK